MEAEIRELIQRELPRACAKRACGIAVRYPLCGTLLQTIIHSSFGDKLEKLD